MRRKVSTLLDDALVRRVKMRAVREGKQISEVLGEAVEAYLSAKGEPAVHNGAVAETWGLLKLDRKRVRRIVEDEGGLFDA
jgi:uncharacterized membrane protein